MFTFFNSESLWIGTDLQRLADIRSALDGAGIPYKYKTRNHMGQWVGHGTLRGHVGSFGNVTEQTYEYEVIVYSKDFEKAKYAIKDI